MERAAESFLYDWQPNRVPLAEPAQPQPFPWQDALLLDEGETIQTYWRGDHAVDEMAAVNGRSQMTEVRRHGYLVLTSHKLAFMDERGIFNQSYHLDCSIELESIEGVSMGGLIMHYVSIGGAEGENKFHLDGVDDKTFDSFRGTLIAQIEARKKEIDRERTEGSVKIMLDFSALRDYMTRGGISVQAVKCPQCRAPLNMPENGNFVKCSYCGSTVYASDIMDRVKQLIG